MAAFVIKGLFHFSLLLVLVQFLEPAFATTATLTATDNNGPVTGSSSLTVTGSSFGASGDISPTLTVGGTICSTSRWISLTAAVCQAPTGKGTATMVAMDAASITAGNIASVFSFDAPLVSQGSGFNFPASGGGSLTLSGSNFGHIDQSPTGQVAGTACSTSRWVSISSVQCDVHRGSGVARRISVVTGALQGTLLNFFTFNSPSVSAVTTTNGPSTGWNSITLDGASFADLDTTPTAKLGGTICMTSSFLSSTSIVCALPKGTGSERQSVVGSASLFGTGTKLFSFNAPTVSNLLNTNAPTCTGASVTLQGDNYGPVDSSPTGGLRVTCSTTAWISATSAACLSGAGWGANAEVTVAIDAQFGTLTVSFTFDAPTVSHIDRVNAPLSHSATLTVSGSSFGGVATSPTVHLGSTICATTKWVTASSLVCSSPVGATLNRRAVATVGGMVGSSTKAFSFDSPVVSSVSAPNAPTSGTSSVTLAGFNFAAHNISPSAVVGNMVCATSQWVSVSSVACRMQTGGTSPLRTGVILNTLGGTLTSSFTFDAPSTTLVSAVNSPTTGLSSITVSGNNFGAAASSPTVLLSGVICGTSSWVSASSAVCGTPAGKGTASVVTSLVTLYGTLTAAFSFDSPAVSFISSQNAPTSGGNSVTLSGTSFGATNVSPTAHLGTQICSSSAWISSSSAVCTPQAGSNKAHLATVAVGAAFGTLSAPFSYSPPVVTSAAAVNAPTSTGSVTVSGSNFAVTDLSPTGHIGLSICATVQWLTTSSLSCLVSAGKGETMMATVTSASLIGTVTKLFSYSAPIVSSAPTNGPATAGSSVTVTGSNFGVVNSSPSVRTGVTICSTSTWISGSSVSCGSSGGGGASAVTLVVGGLMGTLTNSFTFDSPVVSAGSTNLPSTGGGTLTVSGSSFGTGNLSPTVSVGLNVPCTTSRWISGSSLTCTPAAGYRLMNNLAVTLQATVGTYTNSFTFDAPLSTLVDNNGPSTSSASVTISGTNFASTNSSPTVRLGSTICVTHTWISSSSAVCQSASGFGSIHTAVTTVGIHVGTQTLAFTYNAAFATLATGTNVAGTGGSIVSLSGSNFGGVTESPTAYVGTTLCSSTRWVSSSSINCIAHAGSSNTLDANLRIAALVGTLTKTMSFNAPVVTNVLSFNGGTSGGTSVTLYGDSFASSDQSVSAHLGSTVCATSSWVSGTAVKCRSHGGASTAIRGLVAADGVYGTRTLTFSYNSPVVSFTANTNAPGSGASSVTVSGNSFGSKDESPSATLGKTICATSTWVSSSSLTCASKPGAHSNIPTLVETSAIVGTWTRGFSFDAPVTTAIAALNSPTSSAASLTISGTSFAQTNESPTVHLGYTVCLTSMWLSNSAAVCQVAPGSGLGLATTTTIGALVGTATSTFTFDAPAVSVVASTAPNAPTSGMTSLTVSGSNFGSTTLSATVSVGQYICSSTKWISTSTVVCASPSGYHASHRVTTRLTNLVGTATKAFTFSAPAVSYTAVYNGPTTGAASVTVSGNNFGAMNQSPTGHLGSTICQTSLWTSGTSFKCKLGGGQSLALRSLLTVGTLVGTSTLSFSYNGPTVTAVDTTNAPTTVGSSVTLRGSNFGFDDSTPTAYVGTTLCATSVWISASSATCAPHKGKTTAQSALISVDAVFGTLTAAFTFGAPAITGLHAPGNAPTTGGASVTLSGTSFGALASSPTIHLGSTICSTNVWISSSSVVCGSSIGDSLSLHSTVSLGALVGSYTSSFSYNSPLLTYATVFNSAHSGGASVTVSGTAFGASAISQTVKLGSTVCSTSQWISHSSVVCGSNVGNSGGLNVEVVVSSLIGTQTLVMSYNSPTVTSLTTNGASTGGGTVTVAGVNFAVDNESPSVHVGSSICATSAWLSTTSVACGLSSGHSTSLRATVAIHAIFSTLTLAFTYNSPSVTFVTQNAPTSGGASVTLSGSNFATVSTTPSVKVGLLACTTSVWTSATALNCGQPAHFGLAEPAMVGITTLFGTQNSAFSFDAPSVSAVAQVNAPTSGVASITVSGTNLGSTDSSPTFRADLMICATSMWVSATSSVCTLNSDVGKTKLVTGIVAGALGTGTMLFTFDAPLATLVTDQNVPTSASSSVTVSGSNFGATNVSPTALVGSSSCASSMWLSSTAVVCANAAGFDDTHRLNVVASNVIGTFTLQFSYNAPVVTTLLTDGNAPTTGGAVVTVQGTSFSSRDNSPTAHLSGTICATTRWIATSSVLCVNSAGHSKELRATVGMVGTMGTLTTTFTYSAPAVTALAPNNAPVSGGASVTLSGSNFGAQDTSSTASVLGITVCSTTTWVSSSALSCLTVIATANGGAGHTAHVEAVALVGTVLALFSYDSPTLSAGAKTNSPTSGSNSITLSGTDFGGVNSSPTAAVKNVVCSTSMWISTTSAVCSSPVLYNGPLPVTVNAGSLIGTQLSFFTYDSPSVTAVADLNGPQTGGLSVTLSGVNFASTNSSPTVKAMNGHCGTSTWISETSVTCFLGSTGYGECKEFTASIGSHFGTLTQVFTFDAPTISAVSVNTPATGGASLTVSGTNLGVSQRSQTASIGKFGRCTTSLWVSTSAVTCLALSGTGLDHRATLRIDSVYGTMTKAFTFDSPTVSAVSETNAPTSTGSSLTLTGTNFGSINMTPTAEVSHTVCSTTTWVSQSSVTCLSSAGSGGVHAIYLQMDSLAGTQLSAFSHDAPIVSSSSAPNAPTTGTASITLSGTNFAVANSSPTAHVGLTICSTSTWVSSSSFVCSTAASSSDKFRVSAAIGGLFSTNTREFTYDAPVTTLTDSTNTPTSARSSVTVSGANFGIVNTSPTVHVGSSICGTTAWISATSTVCTPNAGSSLSLHPAVTVKTLIGTLTMAMSYNAPAVTSTGFNTPTTVGSSVTVVGSSLGSINYSPTVQFGSTACSTSQWLSGTSVVCLSSPGSSHSLRTQVTLSGLLGTLTLSMTYNAPTVTVIREANAPTSADYSAILTISGSNFGFKDYSSTAYVGSTICTTSAWVSDSALTCKVSRGRGITSKVHLEQSGLVGTLTAVFTFEPPVLTHTLSVNAPPSGSHSITLSGTNFGDSNLSPTAHVGNALCLTTKWLSQTASVCSTAPSSALNQRVTAAVGSLVGTMTKVLTYDAPTLTHVNSFNGAVSGATSVTVLGNAFVTTDASPTVHLGSSICATSKWLSSTTVVCELSAGTSVALHSTVTASGLLGTLTTYFTYDAPLATLLDVFNTPTTAGASVTVSGTSFGTIDASPSAYVGSTLCATSSWVSGSSVRCRSPVGGSESLRACVEVSAITGTLTNAVTYNSPSLTLLSQFNSPTTRGATLTVKGVNFGKTDSSPSAFLGTTMCATSKWVSDSSLHCLSSAGTSKQLRALAMTSSLIGSATSAFSFDSPAITLSGTNLPVTGKGSITLRGANFGATDSTPSGTVGTTLCATTLWLSASTVVCGASAAMTYNLRGVVEVAQLVGTDTGMFSYDSPSVSYVLQFNGATTGATSITVSGNNFGSTNEASVTAAVGTTLCATSRWISTTSITCAIPAGGSLSLHSSVNAFGLLGTQTAVITYDSPSLTLISNFNAPTSAGNSVTLSGTSFVSMDHSPSVTLGTTICGTTTWVSSSSLKCKSVDGTSNVLRVNVRISSLIGSQTSVFSYNAPVVTQHAVINAPTTGTASITMEGTSFGSVDATPTVYVGSSLCRTTRWLSATAAACSAPYGTSNGANTNMAMMSLIGTVSLGFSFDSPEVTWADQINAPATGGSTVTLTGSNFGAAIDYSPSVSLGSTLCATSTWLSESSTKCLSKPGTSTALRATVGTSTLFGTKTNLFSYSSPVASLISQMNTPTTSTASVTVTGSSFGVLNFSPSASIGTTLCKTSMWLSDSSVVCSAPASQTTSLRVNVATSGLLATLTQAFTFNAPVGTLLAEFNAPTTAQTSMTLSGNNFGAVDTTPTVHVGSTVCSTTMWRSVSSVRCNTKAGTSAGLQATTSVLSVLGTLTLSFSYSAPAVTQITTFNSPTSMGASVTVSGTNFGLLNPSPSVHFGSTLCATNAWVSGTSASCLIKSGNSLSLRATVAVNSLYGTVTMFLTYDSPAVTLIEQFNAPLTGATTITVSGSNMGTALNTSPSIHIGSTLCLTSKWVSATSATCGIMGGSSKQLRATVTAAALVGTTTQVFTYGSPTVTSADRINTPSTSGGSVTVSGSNFGMINTTPSAAVGSTLCATSTWISNTAAVCLSMGGSSSGHRATLTVAAILGTRTVTVTYDSPAATLVAQTNTPATGGTSLTVSGSNFSTMDYSLSVSVGSTLCSTSAWVSASSVRCKTSAGSSYSLRIATEVSGLLGSFTASFSYDSPALTHVPELNAPTSGGASITMAGTSFGSGLDYTPTANLGSSVCQTTSWVSTTTARCLSAVGTSLSLRARVETTGLLGTKTLHFTFDVPAVTSVSFNAPTSGTTVVTLAGSNMGHVLDYSPTAHVGSTVCATSRWVSASSIACIFNAGTSHTLRTTVQLNGLLGSATSTFSYDSPVVSLLAQFNTPTTVGSGSSITLSGTTFGATNVTPTAYMGSTVCTTSQWVSVTSVTCAVAAGSSASLRATAVISTLVGTADQTFTYDSPSTTLITQFNAPATGMASITVSGDNFGASDISTSAALGTTMCSTSKWLSSSSVVCQSARSSSLMLRTTIVAHALVGTQTLVLTYDTPDVTLLSQFNSPTSGEASITLSGSNFGASNLSPSAAVGSTLCSTATWVSGSSLLCAAKSGSSVALRSVVTAHALLGTLTSSLTYDMPAITLISQFNSPSSQGTSVTLSGSNLGHALNRSPTVHIGSSVCSTSSWRSASSVTCLVRSGSSVGLRANVQVSSIVGTQTSVMTYDSPAVTSVSWNAPTSGVASITLSGTSMGHAIDYSVTAHLGTSVCATSSWLSASTIVCSASAGTSVSLRANLQVSSLVGTQTVAFSYDSPVVSLLAQFNSPTTVVGGTSITLSGTTFGVVNTSPTAYIGTTVCATSTWVSGTSVQCAVKAGASVSLRATASINTVIGTSIMAFTYDAPATTLVTQFNAPTSGTNSITLTGSNFGAVNLSNTAILASTTCTTSTWVSASSVTCLSAYGTSLGLRSIVGVLTVLGTQTAVFSYDAPVASLVSEFNAPTSAASSVTLMGSNFGHALDYSPTVTVGSTSCATASWLSASTVLCLASAGTSSSLRPNLRVSSLTGTQTSSFSYNSPSVTTVNWNAPMSSASITLSGTNFAHAIDYSVTAHLGSTVCATSKWVSASSVVCLAGAGTSVSLRATLTAASLVGTLTSTFSYNSPVVSLLAQFNAPSTVVAGTTITLSGDSFGATDSSLTAYIGTTVCSSSRWISVSSVTCAAQSGSSVSLRVNAAVHSLYGTTAMSFSYNAPVTTLVSQFNAPTSGTSSVTVSGTNFGAINLSPTTTVGSTFCSTSTWLSASTVVCQTAPGSSLGLRTTTAINTLFGTAASTFTYDTPDVSWVAPYNVPTSGHASVTLSGNNFGATNRTPSGHIGSTLCRTSSWVSSSSMTCNPMSGSSVSIRASVTTSALIGTLTSTMTYNAPALTFISVRNAPASSGSGLTITFSGDSFGASDGTPTVSVGSTLCSTSRWLSASTITCRHAGGSSVSLRVTAELSSMAGTITKHYTYDAPMLTVVYFNYNSPTTSGSSLTLQGKNFGSIDYSPSATMGSTLCATSMWISNSAALCKASSGSSNKLKSNLELSALTGTATQYFSFDPPTMTLVSAVNAPTSRGASFTLNGFNFGVVDTTPSATFGSTLCATSTWLSTTAVTCLTSAGSSKLLRANMAVSDVTGTNTMFFSFDTPVVTLSSTTNQPSTGGRLVTIDGTSFAVINYSPSAYVGSTMCQSTSWVSVSTITCVSPLGNSHSHRLRVLAAGLVGTATKLFSYNSPAVTSVVANSPTTAGPVMVVDGASFGTANGSPSVTVGSTLASTAWWISASSVAFRVAAGSSHSLRATVELSTLVGSLTNSFTYNTPAITQLSAPNAPTTQSASITLTGSNMGIVNPSATAHLGSTVCDTSSWVSASSVVCASSSGASKSLRATLNVNAMVATVTASFTYDSPALTYLAQANAPMTQTSSVTVLGDNFQNANNSPSVWLGATLCATSMWLSTSSAVCAVKSGTGKRLPATMQVDGLLGTRPTAFSFDSPSVTYVPLANSPTSGGVSVTVSGLNYGVNTDTSPSARLGYTLCSTSKWISVTTISCAVHTGIGGTLVGSVEVDSVFGTTTNAFSYNAPVVTQAAVVNGPSCAAASVTLSGTEFGVKDNSPTGEIGVVPCATSSWVSSSAIMCQAGKSSGQLRSTNVRLRGLIGTKTKVYTYDSPYLTMLFTMNAPSTGAISLTLHGSNFGGLDFTPTARYGESLCRTSTWVSKSHISCLMQPGSGSGLTTTVIAGLLVGTRTNALTYASPVVTIAEAVNAPTTAGARVTFSGHNFGPVNVSPTAALGAANCQTSQWVSHTAMYCNPPKGTAVLRHASATNTGLSGTLMNVFSYDSPLLSEVIRWNAPTSGGASLTLRGENFGNANMSPTVKVGVTTCVTAMWTSSSFMRCESPKGEGQKKTVALVVDGLVGTTTDVFTFNSPVFTMFGPVNVPTTAGRSVTVAGMGFGPQSLAIQASIGGRPCTGGTWVSDTSAHCVAPAGTGIATGLSLTLTSLAGTLTNGLTYDAPVLTDVMNMNGPTMGGAVLSVVGGNFGPADSSPTGSIAGTVCSTSRWVSSSAITCVTPAGRDADRGVAVEVDKLSGGIKRAFNYDSHFVEPKPQSVVYAQAGEQLIVNIEANSNGPSATLELQAPTSATDPAMGATHFTGPATFSNITAVGRKVFGKFTWTPKKAGWTVFTFKVKEGAAYTAVMDVTVRVLFCQHLVQAGETRADIAAAYHISPVTLSWVNPGTDLNSVRAYDVINVGRVRKLEAGETVKSALVTGHCLQTYHIVRHNPGALQAPTLAASPSFVTQDYKTATSFNGEDFCVVADLDPTATC